MKTLKKLLGFVAIVGSLTANSHTISIEEAMTLLAPFNEKIEKFESASGAQVSAYGTSSLEVNFESGKKVCEYIYGLRSTKIGLEDGKIKRIQETYSIAKNQFDKDCTNASNNEINKTIFIEKGSSFFRFDQMFFDDSTFDLTEENGNRILTVTKVDKRSKTSSRLNLDELKAESLVIEFNDFKHSIILENFEFNNVDITKVDTTGVEVITL